MPVLSSVSPERWVVACLLAAFAACLAMVAFAAAGAGVAPAAAAGVVVAALAVPVLAARLPEWLDGRIRAHRALAFAWLVVALLALARTAGLAVFMADAQLPQASVMWFDDFYIRHNCFSAWWKAAGLVRDGVANVYASDPYEGYEGRFKLDDFLYLPQFLLLPLAGLATGAGFLPLRALWFVLEAALVAGSMIAVAAWIGGREGRRAALLVPAVWVTTPVLLTLQIGNFQLAAIAMSMLAMRLFDRRRDAAGGALLGFALFKIFPGLLCAYLLFARRWRPLAWTVGFALVYTGVGLAWMGRAPFEAFVHYELPRIANGDAWRWLENEGLGAVVAINASVPGTVLKLRDLGVPGMTHAVEGVVSWIWSALAIAITFMCARRDARATPGTRAVTWLALLAIAAFRSPFVPDTYALFPVIWLWSLVAARVAATPRAIAAMAALWVAFTAVLPFTGPLVEHAGLRLALSGLSQALAVAFCVWVAIRPAPPSRTDVPVHA